MPNHSRLLKRAAAAATLALGTTLSLTSCAGGSGSPEDLFKAYIAALNAGDYETAISMIANPGDLTPENIYNFTDFEYNEPLLQGEPLNSSAESGTISMDLNGESTRVQVEKRDGQWKLSSPVALTPFDYTQQFASFDVFAELGTISFTAANGASFSEPTGYSVLPSAEEADQLITVSLDGDLVPDQQVEIALSSLGGGWPYDELELGDLPARLTEVAGELRYIDYHYDEKAGERVTQEGPITVSDCELRYVDNLTDALPFVCKVAFPEEDFDGQPLLRAGWTESIVAAESKYDNLIQYSVTYFSGCSYGTGAQVESTDDDAVVTVGIHDGEASVFWGYEAAPGFHADYRLSENDITKQCSGWAPEYEGSVVQGITPLTSTDEGTVVSFKL